MSVSVLGVIIGERMRRFLVVVEVIDQGEPDKDGAPIYTLRSAAQAGRWIRQRMTDQVVAVDVRVAEEMLP